MITVAIFDYDKNIPDLYEKFIQTIKDEEFLVYKFSKENDVIDFIKSNHVDIIITECIKDEEDVHDLKHYCGLEFLKNIRNHMPDIKIMICSMYSSHWVSKLLKSVVSTEKPAQKDEFLRVFKLLIKTG